MTKPPAPAAPCALYLDVEGLDTGPGERLLQEHGIQVVHEAASLSAETLARVVVLLVGYGRVDDQWFSRLPALRLVSTHSVGVDMVDIEAARRRGLWVANVGAGATEEVAVHALAMALAVIRRLKAFDSDVRAGRWDSGALPPPRVPDEMTCGVVGMGRIGRRFAELAVPLFGQVLGYDPLVADEAWPTHVSRVDFDELLQGSDCVSLHLPLTEETAGKLGESAIALMPRGAVLVNVSRGPLVDEVALVAALQSGQLSAAALDVLAHEPPAKDDAVLWEHGILLSPHVGYLSPGSLRRYAEIPAQNVIAMLETGAPLSAVVTPGETA